MSKIRLIGISGHTGAGKDLVADHLVYTHGFTQVALADPIKRFGYNVFLFSGNQLWGPSDQKNRVDPRYAGKANSAWDFALGRLEAYGRSYCTSVLGTDDIDDVTDAYNALVHWFFWLRNNYGANLSPRVMLQTLGTEWGRERVSQDIWIDYALRNVKTLLHLDGNTREWTYDPVEGIKHADRSQDTGTLGIVISDIRFENEIKAIREAGGAVIRIVRPETDEVAQDVGVKGHKSEAQEFSFDNFDFIINNNKSIQELYYNVDQYLEIFDVAHK